MCIRDRSNAALQKALEGVDGYELNFAGNIDINRTVDDDEIAVYKMCIRDRQGSTQKSMAFRSYRQKKKSLKMRAIYEKISGLHPLF